MKHMRIAALLSTLLISPLMAFESSVSTTSQYPTIRPTGFARVRFTWDTTRGKADSFTIAQARFGITGDISKEFSYTFSIEGTSGDNENKKMIYDVYIDSTIIPGFKVRAGQFKYALGLEQITAEPDLELINKADMVSGLVSPTRDIGVQVSKDLVVNGFRAIVLGSFFNGSGPNTPDDNKGKMFVGRVSVNPIPGLAVAGSMLEGSTGPARDKKRRVGGDLKYENGPFVFKSEYLWGQDKLTQKDGWYAMGGYVFRRGWMALGRYDRWNPDRHITGKDVSRYTLGVNYYFNKNVLLRNNIEIRREKPEISNNLFMTQIQVKF